MSSKVKVSLIDGTGKPVGCRISRGQLLPALSAVKSGSAVPQGILFAGHSVCAGRFFLCNSSHLYVSVRGGDFVELNPLAGNSPFMFEDAENGIPRAVIVNGKNALAHTGGAFKGFDSALNLSCGVMHCGRLFGADADDGYLLRWSGEGGIEDGEEKLNGAGRLTLDPKRGVILDILEYGEKLVLVREFGLTVLNMFGSPENFLAGITDTDTDRIYKGTARVAGGKLLFFTSSGLKAFDGSAISKISHRYDGAVGEPVCSAEFAGCYFLSCKNTAAGGRCVLCYNSADGESYIIEAGADGICTADCVHVFNADGSYKLAEGGKFSYTADTCFGTAGEKTVTAITVGGEADIEISNGRVSRRFPGASGIIRPRLRGRNFTVTVSGYAPVYSLTAEAEVRGGI